MADYKILWEYIANQYGLELNEEFKVEGRSDILHRFTADGLEFYSTPADVWRHATYESAFLHANPPTIKKLPWKPRPRDEYWFVTWGTTYSLMVARDFWCATEVDETRRAVGNCFRTKEEAEAAKDSIFERVKEIQEYGR